VIPELLWVWDIGGEAVVCSPVLRMIPPALGVVSDRVHAEVDDYASGGGETVFGTRWGHERAEYTDAAAGPVDGDVRDCPSGSLGHGSARVNVQPVPGPSL
jgi:hypothetical protein